MIYYYNVDLYSGRAQPRTSSVIPVDAKNAREISLQQASISHQRNAFSYYTCVYHKVFFYE